MLTMNAAGPALVSIVLPARDAGTDALTRAITSITRQSYSHWELLLVAGPRTSTTLMAYIERVAAEDPRSRVVRTEGDGGPWGDYAHGVRNASGAFLAMHDADGESHPERIERQVEHLRGQPEIGVVGSGVSFVSERAGRVLMHRMYPARVGSTINRFCPMAHGATMRRAGLDARLGSYRPDSPLDTAADYDLWCRWHLQGLGMANLSEILYRRSRIGTSSIGRHEVGAVRDTTRVKRRHAAGLRLRPVDRLLLAAQSAACALPDALIVQGLWASDQLKLRPLSGAPGRGRAVSDTRTPAYFARLGITGTGWRRWVGAQAPYRWNIRRLRPGFVLDVGCGVGRNLAHLDGHGVGVDHNSQAVAEARARGLRAFTVGEFGASSWSHRGQFDSILVAHVLEHLGDPAGHELLSTYLQYLRPGGRVIAIVPQEVGFASDPSHVRYLSARALRHLLESIGLIVERSYSFPFPPIAGRIFRYNETVVVGRLDPRSPNLEPPA